MTKDLFYLRNTTGVSPWMKWVRCPLGRLCYHASLECQKQGHVVYHTRYHVVLVPKYRRKVLKGGVGGVFTGQAARGE